MKAKEQVVLERKVKENKDIKEPACIDSWVALRVGVQISY